MTGAGELKPTLQLRHQLNCSGITIDAAAYDTRRHHLLTYDSHALKPHTLRLFSLRREIRSTPLFDGDNPPPQDVSVASASLRFVSVVYAYELDVFLCIFSVHCGYSVLFLEPASLKKLVVYDGPRAHLLGAACFDEASGRIVLASRILQPPVSSSSKPGSKAQAIPVMAAADVDHSNIIQVVSVSKRSFRRPTSALSVASTARHGQEAAAPDRVMLCVEKLPRLTLRHGDELSCVAAARELGALFGSGLLQYDDDKDSQDCVVVEWRQDPEHGGSLAFVRRIVYHSDVISCVGVAADGEWLFTGHQSGALKVWNVVQNEVVATMTEDGEKTEVRPRLVVSSGDSLASHKSAVATIELKAQTSAEDGEIILFTTERGSGETRHWRFSAVASEANASSGRLDCLGMLDVDPTSSNVQAFKHQSKRKRGAGHWIRTTAICIGVQMGNYSESLLVVTRGDVVHVIKIHALLQVVHDVPVGEEIFTMRSLPRIDGSSALVCFSGTGNFNRLRVSSMDASVSVIEAPRDCLLPAPPQAAPAKTSARVTTIDVCPVEGHDARVVCGWSSGVVEVYHIRSDVSPHRDFLLQDPRLNVDVSAVAIIKTSKQSAGVGTDTQHSWGGLFKPKVPSLIHDDSKKDHFVFAGSASGGIFGWRVAISSSSRACQFVLEASVALITPPVHSAHVVDLLPVASDSSALLSMGADGMVKLWAVPSMQLTGHINAAASAGAAGTRLTMLCSCVQVLDDKVVAVGYEDGAIGVWRRETRNGGPLAFVELSVSGQHERRVSHIVQLRSTFLASASLDMTVVLWSINHESNRVDEMRFFELGAPVVDCCVVGGLLVAALKDEVCWFLWGDVDGEDSARRSLPTFRQQQHILQDSSSALDVSQDQNDAHPEDSSPRIAPPLNSQPEPTEFEEAGVISIPSVVVPGSLVTLDSFGPLPRTSLGDSTSGVLEGWRTDQSSEQLVDAEVIAVYMQQFVASTGTAGTVAAESLGHFLATHRLPLGQRSTRPDFAIRKYLHDHKLDAKVRLNASEATALLLEIQRDVVTRGSGRHNEREDKRVAATSNDPLKKKKQDALLARISQPRTKKERIIQDKLSTNRVAVVTYNILGEKTIKWVDSNQDAEPTATTAGSELLESDPAPTIKSPSRRTRRKRDIKPSLKTQMEPSPLELPPVELLERLHLSPSFRTAWTTGYCWCSSSQFSVRWDEEKSADEAKCDQCHQRRHAVRLHSKSYKPHFSVRMILGIITDVYAQLQEPAEIMLFQNGGGNARGVELSVHDALWRLFQHKYGMQHVVETKLKLLFVSMCHYVREVDAIAVFGELLALFQRPDSDDEQVPQKMVALCVATHSWLYAREMVVNGEPVLPSGKLDKSTADDTTGERVRASHWQFVSLDHALFCAQEVLVYPLVSPGYLRNILMYMDDYSQASATKPLLEDADSRDETSARQETRWIEIHRLLRLLVGEWKQQTSDFRAVERLLFTEPLMAVQTDSEQYQSLTTVLEKLRLILSCFVFYDHERVGAVEVIDFEAILRRLKYLWPNERLTEEHAAGATRVQDSLTFENNVIAASKRFGDSQGDGRIGYLDFWAMLYIMGVRSKTLLKFREIPSFCKDYKLEVSPELHDMLNVYMGRSSSLLLPRGLQTTNSISIDCGSGHAKRQSQRPSGGLSYDGVYVVDRPFVTRTLSMQELLQQDDPAKPKTGLYVDGTMPVLRQSVSTTALDRHDKASHGVATEPVVVGVRPLGPRPKPVAFLSVSSLTADTRDSEESRASSGLSLSLPVEASNVDSHVHNYRQSELSSAYSSESFTNVYIQFPNVTPRQTRLGMPSHDSLRTRSVVGSVTDDHDAETAGWRAQLLEEHEQEARDRQLVHEDHKRRLTVAKEQAATAANANAAVSLAAAHRRHHLGSASPPREKLSPAKPKPIAAKPPSPSRENQDSTAPVKLPTAVLREDPVVVIPSIDKAIAKAPTHGVPTIETVMRHAHDGDHHGESIHATPLPAKQAAPPHTHVVHDLVPKPVVAVAVAMPTIRSEEAVVLPAGVSSTAQATLIAPPETVEVAEKILGEDVEDAEHEEQEEDEMEDGNASEVEPSNDENREEDDEDDDESKNDITTNNVSAPEIVGVEPTFEETSVKAAPVEEVPVRAPVSSEIETILECRSNVSGQPVQLPPATEPTGLKEVMVETRPEQAEKVAEAQKVETKSADDVPQSTKIVLSTAQVSDNVREQSLVPQAMAPKQDAKVTAATPSSALSAKPLAPTLTVVNSLPAAEQAKTPPAVATADSPPKQQPITAKAGSSESRHRFKFSQQPRFKANAAVISNPFKSRHWKPLDDSDSGEDEEADEGGDAYDDAVAVEDMRLRLSRESIASLNKEFNRGKSTRKLGLSTLALVSGVSKRRLGNFHEVGLPRAGSSSDVSRRKTSSPVSLDEDAERALYGGHAANYLGEGIVFSAEAEAEMQRKWLEFFGNAEASMFSPIKQALELREEAQRREEEMQSRLMKKRLEQQNQDTMRLRRNATETAASTSKTTDRSPRHEANFRVRRMTREACLQVQQELKYGETANGELKSKGEAQYFHFAYTPESESHACSILTLKLHVSGGDAEMFMSTETKTPCSSDFMWRSVEKPGNSVTPDSLEGCKIVLFPSDLARVVSTRETLSGAIAPTVFYIAVVSLTPVSSFSIGVMTSGQKAEPSRAIQTVDNLIAHFNQLAKTYEGQASRRKDLLSSSSSTRPSRDRKSSSVDRLRAFLASASTSDVFDELEPDSQELRARRRSSVKSGRRSSNLSSAGDPGEAESQSEAYHPSFDPDNDEDDEDDDDADDEPNAAERSSFQQLLEVIGDKHGFGLQATQSFILGGTNSEQEDFLEDEELRLEETRAKLSPVRVQLMAEGSETFQTDVNTAEMDAIAVVTERRLSTADATHAKLLQRVGARLKQRLSPLKSAAKASDKSASLRVARFAPKLVAYSLSSLPPPKHHHHQLSSIPSRTASNADSK